VSFHAVDHTGDVGFVARAPTLEALFGEAAAAFTDCITPVAGVNPQRAVAIALEALDLELLLVAFLDELLYLFETERFLVGEAVTTIEEGEPVRLRATVSGERLDPERHPVTVAIKAVTYHGLEVRRETKGWRAQVILDI
jgi:SHS2 domain-containing protein